VVSKGRVVFFDAYPRAFSGAQRATLLLMRGLRERGWTTALATPGEGPYVDAARAAGFSVSVLDVPAALSIYGRQTTGLRVPAAAASAPGTWGRLARWLRGRADIAHVADHRGQLLFGPAARLARVPVVWHVHGLDGNRWLNVVCSALAARIVVPSLTVAETLPGLRRGRSLVVVPYALPAEALARPDRRPPAEPVVVTVGRLHPDKGIDVLLRAMVRLRELVPAATAVVVGPPQAGVEAHEGELVDLRHRLGLDGAVELAGLVADPQHLMLQATVYAQPSRERTELQPIAVLEAMAVGLPVVATTVGGVAEMLGHGRFGLLVPPDDPEALAGALARILDDPDLARRLGRAGQAHVREACSAERVLDQVEQVYSSL
jgi:glycosyltransferase involved in cell wall biosynthesis